MRHIAAWLSAGSTCVLSTRLFFVHGVKKLVVAVLLGKVPNQVVGRWLRLGVQSPLSVLVTSY